MESRVQSSPGKTPSHVRASRAGRTNTWICFLTVEKRQSGGRTGRRSRPRDDGIWNLALSVSTVRNDARKTNKKYLGEENLSLSRYL